MPKRSVSDSRLDKAIGSRIKTARRKKGWNQSQLSVALDVQPETVSRYETGDVPVSLAVLFRLASVLGVSPGVLLNIPVGDLSIDEIALMNEWRLLDKKRQRLVLELIRWGRKGR